MSRVLGTVMLAAGLLGLFAGDALAGSQGGDQQRTRLQSRDCQCDQTCPCGEDCPCDPIQQRDRDCAGDQLQQRDRDRDCWADPELEFWLWLMGVE